MFKKILLASFLIVTSMTAQAGLIKHFEYKRHIDSNIVKGGGLEWLKWDQTIGLSINDALAMYSSQGWRLASNVEMASLFNAFVFGKNNWSSDESAWQAKETEGRAEDGVSPHYKFSELFGVTYPDRCEPKYDWCNENDRFSQSVAMFGADDNNNNRYNVAFVQDDYFLHFNGIITSRQFAAFDRDYVMKSTKYGNVGVAIVRPVSSPPTAVPLPGPISLLALGLVTLVFRRRQALRR